MSYYHILRRKDGQTAVEVIWQGDDYKEQCDKFQHLCHDPFNRGCYVWMAARTIGRYVPDDTEAVKISRR